MSYSRSSLQYVYVGAKLNMEFAAVANPPRPEMQLVSAPKFNCYGYSLGVNAWIEPGSLDIDETASRQKLTDAIESDGFFAVEKRPFNPRREHVIAAFYSTELSEFHFARLDGDGTWSHASGVHAPSRNDYTGKPIDDIETADLEDFKFAGYFLVSKEKTRLIVSDYTPARMAVSMDLARR